MYRYPKMTSRRQVNHVIKLNKNPQVVSQSPSKNFKIYLQDDYYIIKDNNRNIIKVKLRVYYINCDTTGIILECRDPVKHDKSTLLQGVMCNKLGSLKQGCNEHKGTKKVLRTKIKSQWGETQLVYKLYTSYAPKNLKQTG